MGHREISCMLNIMKSMLHLFNVVYNCWFKTTCFFIYWLIWITYLVLYSQMTTTKPKICSIDMIDKTHNSETFWMSCQRKYGLFVRKDRKHNVNSNVKYETLKLKLYPDYCQASINSCPFVYLATKLQFLLLKLLLLPFLCFYQQLHK